MNDLMVGNPRHGRRGKIRQTTTRKALLVIGLVCLVVGVLGHLMTRGL